MSANAKKPKNEFPYWAQYCEEATSSAKSARYLITSMAGQLESGAIHPTVKEVGDLAWRVQSDLQVHVQTLADALKYYVNECRVMKGDDQ